MAKDGKLSRREFLFMSGMGVASVVISACTRAPSAPIDADVGVSPVAPDPAKASTAVPTAAPAPEVSASKEAPSLAELVKAGSLPPLEERLPVNPREVTPIHGIGKYGGTLRTLSPALGGELWQAMYSHSPVCYFNDALEIGPGMCESWETNADNSEWTLYFRKGLKWSDGEPCTVDDVMFAWNDMVLNPDHSDQPPDYAEGGGQLVEFIKVDDFTLKLKYLVPRPLTLGRLAAYPKAGAGARWIVPAHYLKQFHPKYNSEYKDYVLFDEKMSPRDNPDCPTLTAWKVAKIEPGVRRTWIRNPYFYGVDTEGNQLPYIDGIDEIAVSDAEVQKMQVIQGNIDYVNYHNMFLEDVSLLRDGEAQGGYETWFWDSGSGTGMNYFWNFDHPDDAKRALYRNPKFKQAMSHAINRPKIQKIVYYDTGTPTTGTMTPKSIEFNFSDEAKEFYAKVRDAYVEYDPDKAMALLDEIGVKDANGDGWREFPDGSKLEVRIDLSGSPNKEASNTLEITSEDWKAVGLNIVINNMASAEFNSMWRGGQGEMRTQWECTGPPEQMAWGGWLMPQEPSRWAPLCGNRWLLRGTPKENSELDVSPWDRTPPRWASTEAGYLDSPIPEMDALFDEAVVEVDPIKRHMIGWKIIQTHIDEGPFIIGTVGNYPRIVIVSERLMNVPRQEETATGGLVNPWIVPCPGQYNPESFSFK